MSKTIDVLKQVYKPLRVTLKGKTTILETTSGKFLVKEKRKDLHDIFNYLKGRNFEAFPSLIDDTRTDLNVFEYIDEYPMPKEQKGLDIIDLAAALHSKTTYYKPVSEDKYKQIYEDIVNNVKYLQTKYQNLFLIIESKVYMSPSEYLLIRNSSKIMASLDFALQEANVWYTQAKEKNKERVALVHNNLSTDHYLKRDKSYLVSWERAKVDTPVLDLVTFYKNEYFNLDFETILERYLRKNPLNEEEKKLFFILISIVDEVTLDNTCEFNSCKRVREILDYLYISEELIRPYYTIQEEKKKGNFDK